MIYAGGPVTNYEPLAREFERKYPGLAVSITGGFSNVLNQKIEQQFKDDDSIDPGVVARAVFFVIEHRVSQGEIEDVKQVLPAEMRELWP